MQLNNKKNFFLGSRFLSALADQIILFATPLVVYELTGSVAFAGLAFAIEWIPRIGALLFSGFLVDKIGPRIVYISSDVARAILTAGIFFVLQVPSLQGAFLLAVLCGIVGFFSEMAFVALETSVPKMFDRSEISKAQSILQTIDQTGQLVGPALATLLASIISIQSLFLIVAVIFALSVVNTFLFLPANLTSSEKIHFGSFGRDLKDGLKIVFGSKKLILISLFTIMINLILGVTLSVSGAYIQKAFSATPTNFGLMTMAAGILGLFFFAAFAKWNTKISSEKLGYFALILTCSGCLALSLASSFTFYALAFVMVLIGDGFVNIFIRTLRVRYIPEKRLGTVLSILILFNFLAFPIAGVLVSLFAESIGVSWLFGVLAILVGGVGIAVLKSLNEAAPQKFVPVLN